MIVEKSIIDKNCVILSQKFVCHTRLVEITKNRKRKIAVVSRDSRPPLYSLIVWNDFHIWGCWSEKRAQDVRSLSLKVFFSEGLLSTGEVFETSFSGIVYKYRITDVIPVQYLTVFKAENSNAHKKTKFGCRDHHFSFPLVFSRNRFSRHNQVPAGVLQLGARSWLARKLIRSIRCDRHMRKHVGNEACNLVFKAELLALRGMLCVINFGRQKTTTLCLNESKLINHISLIVQWFKIFNFSQKNEIYWI